MSEQKIKYIVRIANNDLNGQKPAVVALQGIKGIGQSLANTICRLSDINLNDKLGSLSEEKIAKINNVITKSEGIPVWMKNRQKDYETGESMHILAGDLDFTFENDLKRLKKVKSYRGLRHQWGLTVRGQKTKSNHRRSKAKRSNITKKGKK
ncbi:MAG: 30S ribosomal protein S13 [Candidatus Woesearchaeota archaeon]